MKVYICETGDQELTEVCKIYKDRKKAIEWRKLAKRVIKMIEKGNEMSIKNYFNEDHAVDSFLYELNPICKKLGFVMFTQTWADFHRMNVE